MGVFRGKRNPRRKVKSIDIPVSDPHFIENLVARIKRIQWPYTNKVTAELLQKRDQALPSLISIIGPRIGEALRFQKKCFTVLPDRVSVAPFLPEKNGLLRENLWLPRIGLVSPLTDIFMAWFNEIPDDPEAFVFPSAKPFGRIRWNQPLEPARAFWIIKSTTGDKDGKNGLFPHFYRGVAETLVGKVVLNNDPFQLKEYMGLRRIENTFPYVGEQWTRNYERFFKAS